MRKGTLPDATIREKMTFDHPFCVANLLFRQNNYIYLLINVIHFRLWPMYHFRKSSMHKLYQSKLLICTKKTNKCFFGGSFNWNLKAKRFQNTLDLHYDQRIRGRNDFENLDNAVLLPQKIHFFSTSGHKIISYEELI